MIRTKFLSAYKNIAFEEFAPSNEKISSLDFIAFKQLSIYKMHCEQFYLNLELRKGWRNVNGIFSFGQYILASLVGEVARRRSDGGVMLR